MPLPKTILVPTDFGEPSEAALDYAIDLARANGGQIVLLHAYEMPVIGMPDGALLAAGDIVSRMADGAEIGLDRQLASRGAAGVPLRKMLKQGPPHAMINEAVEEVGADLVVVGTHGRRGLPRVLLGSVAEKVVRTAKVPVLTVHAGDAARPKSADPVWQASPESNGVSHPPSHR